MNNESIEPGDYIAMFRNIIDGYLIQMGTVPEGIPARLRDAMTYSLLLPGKRIRPIMTLLASRWCGGKVNEAIGAAVAVEMIHCYSLIHDDLPAMDDDDFRRGQPTNHKQFDEATAILAGDALLTLAFETIATTVAPARIAIQCCRVLAQAAGPQGMIAGQEEDLIASGRLPLDTATIQSYGFGPESDRELILRRIHHNKTVALLSASLALGAITAQGTPKRLEALKVYGESYGLAFQITDDLLDATGDETTVGKRLRKDAEHGKLTFTSLYDIETCRRLARVESDRAIAAIEKVDPFSATGQALVYLARNVVDRTN